MHALLQLQTISTYTCTYIHMNTHSRNKQKSLLCIQNHKPIDQYETEQWNISWDVGEEAEGGCSFEWSNQLSDKIEHILILDSIWFRSGAVGPVPVQHEQRPGSSIPALHKQWLYTCSLSSCEEEATGSEIQGHHSANSSLCELHETLAHKRRKKRKMRRSRRKRRKLHNVITF